MLLGENAKVPLALPTWTTLTWTCAVAAATSARNQKDFIVTKVLNVERETFKRLFHRLHRVKREKKVLAIHREICEPGTL
jgi:hypothetical protein